MKLVSQFPRSCLTEGPSQVSAWPSVLFAASPKRIVLQRSPKVPPKRGELEADRRAVDRAENEGMIFDPIGGELGDDPPGTDEIVRKR